MANDIAKSGLPTAIEKLLREPGPYNDCIEEYTYPQAVSAVLESRILVIGAGGLGCEILKNLAMCGFRHVDVIDMDTIDVSNLNRQFLFRSGDVGCSKAEVAARFVLSRVKTITITPHFARIQEKPLLFYKQFSLVICGLDNVEARRWINALLVGIADTDLIPMVDGGTEGFRGQARVIIPTVTSCFECSLDLILPKLTYPVCTIANTPRLPEHCIEWASQLEWPRLYPGRIFDADNSGDVDIMYKLAHNRAVEHGIDNVTRSLTLGVVKNIIPAIASTNAIVAAACCNEVFKLVTSCNPLLDNYMMYLGDDSVFTYTYAHLKKPTCAVCGNQAKHVTAQRWWTLQDWLDQLKIKQEFFLPAPSLSTARGNIYMRLPAFLEASLRPNLARFLRDLVSEGEEILVTDALVSITMKVVIDRFEGPDSEPEDISSILRR